MSHTVLRSKALSNFSCLGDKCEDTCCQQWSMQVDEETIALYRNEAPELLAAVESSKDVPWIMRKDPATGFCVKLQGGLCGIHKERGDRMLGDACFFYPRMTRALGSQVLMDAVLSCPEVVRQALYQENPCDREYATIDRIQHTVRDVLPEQLAQADALAIHNAFIDTVADTSFSVEEAFVRVASVTRSIQRVDMQTWPQAVPFYLKNVGMWIPMSEPNPNDPFNLLHALAGLIVASRKQLKGRIKDTLDEMQQALAVTLDWEKVLIQTSDDSAGAFERLRILWKEEGAGAAHDHLLRRYLQMQLAEALFPFAGIGRVPAESITIIGVRLATIKLALMSACAIHGSPLPQDVVVRVIQSISRLLDHLASSEFSLQIYAETGWTQEGRMRSLLEM